ncbi:MAG: ATP-grasp domain-containing protein [Verrucomicrobia bacterium]|nr:ATP-grasp domain-containing protein [Verrucomicrobiota bacterium]
MIRFCWALFILCLSLLAAHFVRQEKRVLILAPSKYEESVAERFAYKYYFYYLPELSAAHYSLPDIVNQVCSFAREHQIDAILCKEDYAGAALAAICAKELGLVAPDPTSILTCSHKYYARCAQKRSVPEACPAFSLGVHLPFPCFVKPIKSSFSRYAQVVNSRDDEITMPPASYFDFFDQLIAYATPFPHSEERKLCEGLLEGIQLTWEGYVYKGEVSTIGIVDSIMYPGTFSFQRFQYPSSLPQDIQRRIEAVATTFLTHVGLDNTVCNIELMYDPQKDLVSIIEINPRIAMQFCDLYEKVDGTNSYEIALAIATGAKPEMKKNEGAFRVAASFVLRHFEDAVVTKVPSKEEIAVVKSHFPEAIVMADYRPGQKLSSSVQDGVSFRYGVIHLGGQDEDDLFARYEECTKALTFTLEPINANLR